MILIKKIDRFFAFILKLIVNVFSVTVRPLLGGNVCRFSPSCTQYCLQALAKHGALKGSWLTAKRLLRCHPFCEGGIDPVP